jgi:short-subunit dehydrogenase
MNLDGAVVLLTGASSGIGAATAPLLADRGARLLLAGRDHAALTQVAERCGGQAQVNVQVLIADLAEPGAADRLATEALARYGRVDLLINNAGAGWAGPLTEMPPALADQLATLNLLAPVHLTRLLLPGMLRHGHGHLAFVASIAGATGVGGEAVYAATKAALATFAASLREELAGTPIGVTVIVPGVIDTPFFARRGTPYPRTWPRPIPPERVAHDLVNAVESGRAEVFTPRWMRLPARLAGATPALYRMLAIRFGATRSQPRPG